MSSRALRRLEQERQEKQVDNEEQEEEEEEEESMAMQRGAKPKRQNRNPFELLDRDSCSESEVKEDDDLGTESSRSNLKREDTRKKRKKKTRKKGAKPIMPKSSEDNQEFDDEVARSVHEVNQLLGEIPSAPSASASHGPAHHKGKSPQSALRALLAVEYKNLNPENEMKKLFGSRVVQAEMRQHRANNMRGGRARAHVRGNHSVLVPKGNWPNMGKGGLSMRFIDSDAHGNQFFSFEHSKSYQDVQKQFFVAVESMNPDFIVQILNHHPFHVDSMLQLSEICKMGEDTQMATELIERTLFSMEAAFHPLFNLAVGTCRLEYKRQENRAFYIALFRHLNSVGSRACYRTALEFCKLTFSLDPDADPMGVLLLMDFYAVRSDQHRWFVKLYEELEEKKNLSQLPNWAYSVSLAHFHLAEKEGDYEKADEMLQAALIRFPGVLLPLLDKCSIDADKVARHRYFVEAQLGQAQGLQLLTNLYIGHSYHLWKVPEVLPWLERNCSTVVDRVETGIDPEVTAWETNRAKRYQGVPRNIHRHVIMSDIKEATTSLPKELSDAPVLSYDPLPPPDSIDLYDKSSSSKPTQVDDPNVMRVFLRSLLPNFNPNDPAAPTEEAIREAAQEMAQQAGGAAGGGANGAGAGLRNSVNSVYEALHDLLSHLHLPQVPHDGADSEDSDDENDQNWD